MDFATFRQAMMNVPAQILSTGRKIVYRLLAWNPWQHVFFRLLDQLRQAVALLRAATLKPESGCSGPPSP